MTRSRKDAREITAELRVHPSLSRLLNEPVSDWVGVMCTQIAIALGDEQLDYIDGTVSLNDGHLGANITVFTPDRLIRVLRDAGDEAASVWTFSRSDLTSVEIMGGASIFEDETLDDWAGTWWCQATYPGGTIELGRRSGSDTARRPAFELLVRGLFDDLARRHRAARPVERL